MDYIKKNSTDDENDLADLDDFKKFSFDSKNSSRSNSPAGAPGTAIATGSKHKIPEKPSVRPEPKKPKLMREFYELEKELLQKSLENQDAQAKLFDRQMIFFESLIDRLESPDL